MGSVQSAAGAGALAAVDRGGQLNYGAGVVTTGGGVMSGGGRPVRSGGGAGSRAIKVTGSGHLKHAIVTLTFRRHKPIRLEVRASKVMTQRDIAREAILKLASTVSPYSKALHSITAIDISPA